jgi:hypothetical protein
MAHHTSSPAIRFVVFMFHGLAHLALSKLRKTNGKMRRLTSLYTDTRAKPYLASIIPCCLGAALFGLQQALRAKHVAFVQLERALELFHYATGTVVFSPQPACRNDPV